jgi:hypothetical protein
MVVIRPKCLLSARPGTAAKPKEKKRPTTQWAEARLVRL